MILVVTGGRDYADRERVFAALDRLRATTFIRALYHGACGADYPWTYSQARKLRGADRWAHEWATERGVEVRPKPAEWKRLGKAAGPKRNEGMLAGAKTAAAGSAVLVVACPGGDGTTDCVRHARAAGLAVKMLDELLALPAPAPRPAETPAPLPSSRIVSVRAIRLAISPYLVTSRERADLLASLCDALGVDPFDGDRFEVRPTPTAAP